MNLEEESAQGAKRTIRTNDCEVTRDHSSDAGQHPKDNKLRAPVEFLHVRTNDPETVHVHSKCAGYMYKTGVMNATTASRDEGMSLAP